VAYTRYSIYAVARKNENKLRLLPTEHYTVVDQDDDSASYDMKWVNWLFIGRSSSMFRGSF